MLFFLVLITIRAIQIPSQSQEHLDTLELIESDEQQLKKLQSNNQVFLLDIADYFEGTTIYNFLDLQNKDNQSKRIVIATVLSILLIIVCCVLIQFILDLSKKCKIKISKENVSLNA